MHLLQAFRRLISWFIYEYFLGSYYWLALGQTTLGFPQNGQSVAHAKNEPFSLLTNAPTTFDITIHYYSEKLTINQLLPTFHKVRLRLLPDLSCDTNLTLALAIYN